jgi:hypothetical protein
VKGIFADCEVNLENVPSGEIFCKLSFDEPTNFIIRYMFWLVFALGKRSYINKKIISAWLNP